MQKNIFVLILQMSLKTHFPFLRLWVLKVWEASSFFAVCNLGNIFANFSEGSENLSTSNSTLRIAICALCQKQF